MSTREASHAGSWYSGNKSTLENELNGWLNNANYSQGPARAIISPHAGYSYSGPTAGHAFKQIDPTNIKRVFILGPSHHVSYGESCVLSPCKSYATPLYNLPIDEQIYDELKATNVFGEAKKNQDENEHSLEMQIPYIAKVMESRRGHFKIVPIIVSNLSSAREKMYGEILAPYLLDHSNLFVISSDFCHWGKRFNYTYYDEKFGDIWKSISDLDRRGMNAVESLVPNNFTQYLQEYRNTICGRHPIGVLLNMVDAIHRGQVSSNGTRLPRYSLKFVKYAQSEQVKSMNSSSVSYAAASLVEL